MNDLAWSIRHALECGIEENPRCRFIERRGDGYAANAVGLAVIGKLGIDEALLIDKLMQTGHLKKAEERVNRELGLSTDQVNTLVANHHTHSAEEIAVRLDDGWTIDAISSHPYPQKDVFDTP